MRIQDLFFLCLRKWYWFVLSLVITVGAAVIYLLTTPPVYTRSASLLIKEDSKGNSMNDAAGVLGNMDIFQTSTNVNNEIQSLQSPSVMLEVVKRLHLDISYHTDGRFYKKVLYSSTCPYRVSFSDLPDNENVSFTINPTGDGQAVRISDFTCNGQELESEAVAISGEYVETPVGKLVIDVADTSVPDRLPVGHGSVRFRPFSGTER